MIWILNFYNYYKFNEHDLPFALDHGNGIHGGVGAVNPRAIKQQDPLRLYIQNRLSHEVKVKTLSEIELKCSFLSPCHREENK
jgi:hypothetical protein